MPTIAVGMFFYDSPAHASVSMALNDPFNGLLRNGKSTSGGLSPYSLS
jgi:hypothetical protein